MSDSATILLVDDDDDFAEPVAAFLGAHGFRVERARSARDGVAMARTARPTLVLMDVMMESSTAGYWAVQELRRDPALRTLPILVTSSIYAAIPGFRVAREAGWLAHDGFLAKPVDLDELLAIVRERIAGATAVAAAEAPP
jgi:CheY-like chemotaxis protein